MCAFDYIIPTGRLPLFFLPEQCEGQGYNSKSDIWSLGCILYECMTASRPNSKDRVAFSGENIGTIFMSILSGKYQPLPEYDESSDLVKVLRMCLRTDPGKGGGT